MSRKKSVAVLLALLLGSPLAPGFADTPPRGEVASVNPVATQAGVDAIRSGGNAIDAAVAVGLTLGVVDSHNSGIGGGCFMLIHLASGTNVCVDGREMAPAAATRDMFIRDGKADPDLSETGPLASGIPGEIAAFDFAEHHYGKKTLRDLILPAAAIAEKGFPVTARRAQLFRSFSSEFEKFPSTAAVYLPHGKPLAAGDVFKQPDLTATYRHIAESGADWFYHGPFAQAAGAWMKANGGIMTATDFACYQIELRQPIETAYRGYEVVSFPPPSSGVCMFCKCSTSWKISISSEWTPPPGCMSLRKR